MKLSSILLYSIVFIFFSCRSSQSATDRVAIEDVIAEAYVELGSPLTWKESPENTFILCIKEIKGTQTLELVVIERETREIVLPKTKIVGKVGWNSDSQLKVEKYTGIVKRDSEPDDHIYYIDINDKTEKI